VPWKHQVPPSLPAFRSTALQRLQSILSVYVYPRSADAGSRNCSLMVTPPGKSGAKPTCRSQSGAVCSEANFCRERGPAALQARRIHL
jgi:hypothetical protein